MARTKQRARERTSRAAPTDRMMQTEVGFPTTLRRSERLRKKTQNPFGPFQNRATAHISLQSTKIASEEISLLDDEDERNHKSAYDDDERSVIVISDDEEEQEEASLVNLTSSTPLFSSDHRPLGFLPNGQGGRRCEERLARTKSYGPVWIARPAGKLRPGFGTGNAALWGLVGIWVDDCRSNPRLAADQPRIEDIDALPRWFGPLNFTTIHFNHGRLPRNSLEFFSLCFQPVQDGDMQVWIKYREIEEEIWGNSWDKHSHLKRFIGDLHGIAFGQKETASKRVEQMEKSIRLFREYNTHEVQDEVDYFRLATA